MILARSLLERAIYMSIFLSVFLFCLLVGFSVVCLLSALMCQPTFIGSSLCCCCCCCISPLSFCVYWLPVSVLPFSSSPSSLSSSIYGCDLMFQFFSVEHRQEWRVTGVQSRKRVRSSGRRCGCSLGDCHFVLAVVAISDSFPASWLVITSHYLAR